METPRPGRGGLREAAPGAGGAAALPGPPRRRRPRLPHWAIQTLFVTRSAAARAAGPRPATGPVAIVTRSGPEGPGLAAPAPRNPGRAPRETPAGSHPRPALGSHRQRPLREAQASSSNAEPLGKHRSDQKTPADVHTNREAFCIYLRDRVPTLVLYSGT